MLHLFALGELRLESGEGVGLSRRRKPLVLLTFLARRAPRPVSRVELAALLWGERPDARARQSLRQALLELHRLVGDRLVVTAESVRLVADDLELDVARFEEDVAAGRDEEAIARWTGGFCDGAEESGESAFRAWADAEGAGLRRRLTLAYERRLDEAASRGDERRCIELARAWTTHAPLDEQAALGLVSALRRAGQPVDALATHTSFVARLREELDAAPSRAFLALASSLGDTARTPPAMPATRRPHPEEPSRATHSFVGRQAAFLALSTAWRDARTAAPAIVVVRAGHGMGASRLCEELVRWAMDAEPATLVVRAEPRAQHESRFIDAGAVLRALSDSPALGGLAPESLAALNAVLPGVSTRFTHLPALADAAPARLARAVREALNAVAEDAPVIVVIDRLDQMEAGSRELLLDAIRGLTGAVLVVMVAGPRDEELRAIEHSLAGARAIAPVVLEPLRVEDIGDLLSSASALDRSDAARLATELWHETGGVPAFLIAQLDAMIDDGTLAAGGRPHTTAPPSPASLPVPAAVLRLVEERREALGGAARRLLDGAAVFGRPVRAADLATLGSLSLLEAAEGVDELARAGLLLAGDGDRYTVAPPIVQRAVYALVPPLRREVLHAASAALLPPPVSRWRMSGETRARVAHHRERSGATDRRRPRARWPLAVIAATLVIVAGALVAAWPRRVAPVRGTTVAIFPFAVSGDAKLRYLEAGMVDLLSASLDGAAGLRTIDPRAVIAAAQRQPGASPIALEKARGIATTLGARYFVLGTVLGAGDRLEMSASLYTTDRADVPVTHASASGLSGGLFDIVDRVTAQLAVAQGAPGSERLARLAAVTTPSLEALKAYLEAQNAYRANDLYAAIPAYQRAVAADSTFALAWYGLASAASWMLRPGLEQHAAAQAVRFGARLSARDRTLLAGFAAYSRGQADSAERMAAGLAEAYDDIEAWVLLGEVLYHHDFKRGRSATESRHAWERVLALDPHYWPALEHLAEVAALEGNARQADSLLARYEQSVGAERMMVASRALRAYAYHDPASRAAIEPQLASDRGFWLILSVWYVSVFGRDFDDAQRLARMLVVPLRPPEQQGFGRVLLAHLALARGHWREARAELAIARAHDPVEALEQQLMLSLLPPLATPATQLDSQRADLERVAAVPRAESPSTIPWPRTPATLQPLLRAYLAGMSSARSGDEAGRERAMSQLAAATDPTATTALRDGFIASVRAEHERALGRPAAALALLEQGARATPFVAAWTSSIVAQAYERFVRAELLHELGRDDEALRWYGTFGENSPYDLVYLAPSLMRQAQILDARGERRLAAERYARFLELWKDCDPELRPLTALARARLAALR